MSESEHTPTPWVTGDVDHGGNPASIFRMFGECVADCEFSSLDRINAANAAFIVRAVNSHDALVSALEDAHSFMIEMRARHGDSGVGILIRAAHAALATAKGES